MTDSMQLSWAFMCVCSLAAAICCCATAVWILPRRCSTAGLPAPEAAAWLGPMLAVDLTLGSLDLAFANLGPEAAAHRRLRHLLASQPLLAAARETQHRRSFDQGLRGRPCSP